MTKLTRVLVGIAALALVPTVGCKPNIEKAKQKGFGKVADEVRVRRGRALKPFDSDRIKESPAEAEAAVTAAFAPLGLTMPVELAEGAKQYVELVQPEAKDCKAYFNEWLGWDTHCYFPLRLTKVRAHGERREQCRCLDATGNAVAQCGGDMHWGYEGSEDGHLSDQVKGELSAEHCWAKNGTKMVLDIQ